jgi:sugar O-acyltransferase (sialic acid O-acetyltransferase NeuD family)
MKKLIIFGTGYTDIIKLIDAINRSKNTYEVVGWINDFDEFQNKVIFNYPVIGKRDVIPKMTKGKDNYFVNNINSVQNKKEDTAFLLDAYHCQITSLMHPSIDLAYVDVGKGCIAQEGCVFGAGITIGRDVTFRLHVVISHDVSIGDFAYFGPGVVCGGSSKIGAGSYVGAGVTVMSGITIGNNSVIGAGAVVTKDVPSNTLAVGVPAKPIKTINRLEFRGKAM